MAQRRFYARVWWPLFVALQVVATTIISIIEPEGFDRCTAAPSSVEQRTQVIVAVFSLVVPLAVALWQLRWRYLLICAPVILLPALFWLEMLRPVEPC